MWCWLLLLLLFLTSMEVFHIIAFRRHPSPFRGLSLGFLHPFLYFQPSPSQSDSRHFNFNVSRFFIFTGSATVLSERFLPMGVFTLYSFVSDSGEGRNTHPIQDPPLCLPSQSCFFRLAHGLELLMFELQDHWHINCASEPRGIESKLKYWMFRLFKVSKIIICDSPKVSKITTFLWLAQSQQNDLFRIRLLFCH